VWAPCTQLNDSVNSRFSFTNSAGDAEVLPISNRLLTLISDGVGGPKTGRLEPRLCREYGVSTETVPPKRLYERRRTLSRFAVIGNVSPIDAV